MRTGGYLRTNLNLIIPRLNSRAVSTFYIDLAKTSVSV